MDAVRVLGAAVAAALLAVPHGATAKEDLRTFAGEVRTATTTFELGGRDGRTWLVGVALDEVRPVGGTVTRGLAVTLQPCTVRSRQKPRCAAATTYRTPVTASQGAVADDLSTAYVRARVAGALVDLSWSVAATHSTSVATVSDQEVTAHHAYASGSGPVVGVVLGPRCRTSGWVGGTYVVRRGGPPPQAGSAPPSTLPRALLPASGWSPRCV